MCVKKHDHHGVWMDGVSTRDMERSRADRILPDPWQTDTSIGPWGYVAGVKYRDTVNIVHELIDIVSKNGNLAAECAAESGRNAGRGDGAHTGGDWRVDARQRRGGFTGRGPWRVYGDEENAVRFVKKDRFLYAHFLRWPGRGRVPCSAYSAQRARDERSDAGSGRLFGMDAGGGNADGEGAGRYRPASMRMRCRLS